MKLPENVERENTPFNKRNVLEIIINENGKILVNNKEIDMDELQKKVKDHINNNGRNKNSAINPKKALIFLKQSRGTHYRDYIEVHNILNQTYNDIRNEIALNISSNRYNYDLSKKNETINSYASN